MGPWSRSFVVASAGRSERPSDEALGELRDLTVEVGIIRAQCSGCTVTLRAEPVSPAIWSAMVRFARGRGPLEEAVAGRTQSVQLEHLLAEDWGEALIPRGRSIAHGCSCDAEETCEHVVALAHLLGDRIDAAPMLLLRWRGCVEDAAAGERRAGSPKAGRETGDPWKGAALPASGAIRALPARALLDRLGPSGIRVDDEDLGDILGRAYDVLGSDARTTPST